MIKIKVKTIWNGRIGIRDKYIIKSQKEKQDLFIKHNEDMMEIPYNNVSKKVVAKSKFPIKDRFSKEKHYLIYFDWKPTTIQSKLF